MQREKEKKYLNAGEWRGNKIRGRKT